MKDAPLAPQQKPYPLVIFSHGWQGDRFSNSWIAEALVDEGYIVAMIDHAHNNSYENSGEFPEVLTLEGRNQKKWHKDYLEALLERDKLEQDRVGYFLEKLVQFSKVPTSNISLIELYNQIAIF